MKYVSKPFMIDNHYELAIVQKSYYYDIDNKSIIYDVSILYSPDNTINASY